MNLLSLAFILAFICAGRWLVSRPVSWRRDALFCLLNLSVLYGLFYRTGGLPAKIVFSIYVLWVGFQYLMLARFAGRPGRLPWLAFFTPILALVFLRYGTPPDRFAVLKLPAPVGSYFVGISYLAFRSSYLVIQIRNGMVKPPGFWAYLSFCFFVPTFQVGPISPYTEFSRALAGTPVDISAARAGLRLLVGAIKYQFFGQLCNQLAYVNLMQDDFYHHWVDLPVAMVFYYLYLYCNFSGFCDMAIGAAGLIGIPVAENFDNPFAARNVKDFWNRWHITLSTYMRDVVFAPLSKQLVRSFGPANANHAIALTIIVVFLLVGVWHGVGWNYFIYGAIHALGVVTNHYYTIGLKRWLGREGFKAYNENRWIHAVAVVLTFAYCAASLLFFANTMPEIKYIFGILK